MDRRVTGVIRRQSAAPSPTIRRVRKWGDPVLVQQAGLSVKLLEDLGFVPSNFQPVPLLPVREDANGNYIDNSGTWSAIANSIIYQREDVDRIAAMQDTSGGYTIKQKMQWWCWPGKGVRPAWCNSDKDAEGNYIYDYSNSPVVYWGTIAIGGRPLQIDKQQSITIKLPEEPSARSVLMGRVVCFRKSQFGQVTPQTHSHLIQAQAGAGKNDVYISEPKGNIYALLPDPRDWDFAGAYRPTAFYIPMDWLE
jgi:hypothetical protein